MDLKIGVYGQFCNTYMTTPFYYGHVSSKQTFFGFFLAEDLLVSFAVPVEVFFDVPLEVS